MQIPSTTGSSIRHAVGIGTELLGDRAFLFRAGGERLGAAPAADLPGRPLLPSLPDVRVLGSWPEAELRVVDWGRSAAVFVGHCIPDATEVLARGRELEEEPDALMSWPGAYACLLMLPERTLCYTDVAAQFAVYESTRGGQTLIASDPRLLAQLHGRRLDPLTAAIRLACPDVLPLWESRSPFEDVSRLPGGHVLEVRHGVGRSAAIREYAQARTARDGSRADGAAALGVALRQAVAMRCARGPVTTDLSGGLDSTSIALLAAKYSPNPIQAVVYQQPTAPAADVSEARRCVLGDSRIALTVLDGSPDTLPYAGEWAPGMPWPAGPEPWAGALAWRRSALRLAFAAEHGARTHLTGEGGDAVLTAAPSYLADLVRWSGVPKLVSHSSALCRARDTSRVKTIARAARLKRTGAAISLELLAKKITATSGERSPDWLDSISWWPLRSEPLSWLTDTARTLVADAAAQCASSRNHPRWLSPAESAAATSVRLSAEAQIHLRGLGQDFGVSVHAPFLDPAVIRACLSVPAELRADTTVYKPLLSLALAGDVPPIVFDRHTKGDYSAEDYQGARRHRPTLDVLLRDSRLADLGVIEPSRVTQSLVRLRAGVGVPLGPLNHLLALEAWSRAFETVDWRRP